MSNDAAHAPTKHHSPADAALMAFEALGRRDVSNAHEIWAEDVEENFLALEMLRGRAATVEHFETMFAAMPDLRIVVEDILEDGRTAVVQWRATGTFTGEPMYGLIATGRRMDVRGVDVVRYNDEGLVARNDIYYDGAAMMRELGVLPPRESPQERVLLGVTNLRTRVSGFLRRR